MLIDAARGTTIKDNVISANLHDGISIQDGASRTLVVGNKIGTNPDGDDIFDSNGAQIGNKHAGVLIDGSSDNFIGLGNAGDPNNSLRNVISGNGFGIGIQSGSEGEPYRRKPDWH